MSARHRGEDSERDDRDFIVGTRVLAYGQGEPGTVVRFSDVSISPEEPRWLFVRWSGGLECWISSDSCEILDDSFT